MAITPKAGQRKFVYPPAKQGLAPYRYSDRSGQNLTRRDFTKANFRGSNLRGADLSSSRLDYADFTGADLRDAKLNWAYAVGADFTDADMRGAEIGGVDEFDDYGWSQANLTNTRLVNEDLRDSGKIAPVVFDAWLGQNTGSGVGLGLDKAWLLKERYKQLGSVGNPLCRLTG